MTDTPAAGRALRYRTPALFVLGLMAYTVSVYTSAGERLDILDTVRHQFVMGIVLLALAAKSLMDDMPDLSTSRELLVAVGALFVVIASHVPFAADFDSAWPTFVDYVVKEAIFMVFIVAFVRSPRDMRWLLFAFLFSIFWVLAESVRGLVSGSLVWRNQGIQRLHGAVNLYRHPNGLSLIAVTSVPFVLYLLGVVRNWLLRGAMLALLGMAVICIIYTGSRAGYVGTLAILFFWWFFARRRVRGLMLGLLCAAVIAVSLPEQYRERFMSIAGEEEEGHSKDARLQIMKDAWAVFLSEPFGVGVNSFMYVRQQRFGQNQDVHNLYLQVLSHLGIQGFAVFMVFAVLLYRSFARLAARQQAFLDGLVATVRRQRPPPDYRASALRIYRDGTYVTAVVKAFRLYVIMLLVNGIFAHTLYLICWWFAAGAAVALQHIGDGLEDDVRRLQATLRGGGEGDSRFDAGDGSAHE